MARGNAIFLCTDRNMLVPACFVAASVIRQRAAGAAAADVVIITDDEAATARERDWIAAQGIRHEVADFSELRSIFDRNGRLTTATLVKLTLAERYHDRYARILYLDSDLTIHADVTPLFGLDLGGTVLAANRRAMVLRDGEREKIEQHFADLGMTRPFRYFNSGVMLIDVDRWSGEDLTRRCLAFISANRELCPLPDEDALNAILDGRFAALSPVWNLLPRREHFMGYHERIDPAIVHYSGHDKPWKRFGWGKPLFPDMQACRLYRAFLADSPWPDWLRKQWTAADLWLGLRFAARQAREAIAGRPATMTRAERRDFEVRLSAHLAGETFIDVSQGLTLRSGDRLSVRR